MANDTPSFPSESTIYFSKIILAAVLLLIAIKLADRAARRTDPLPAVPEPNAYETLVDVARKVETPAGDLTDMSSEEIRKTAESNRKSIERLHEALRKEMAVPLSAKKGWGDEHASDVKKLKRLAIVLGIQSKAELLEGRTNKSAAHLVDVILLGQSLARGGMVSDGINSMVIETIGTASLRAQIAHLDAGTCRSVAQELERSEGRREPAERVFKTQKTWSIRSFGLIGRFGEAFTGKSQGERRAEFIKRYSETTRRTRRLILLLAARAVELESGRKVKDPNALVPAVLVSVPVDPETNRELPLADASQGER